MIHHPRKNNHLITISFFHLNISGSLILSHIGSTNYSKYQLLNFPVNTGIFTNYTDVSFYRTPYRKNSHFKPNSFTFPTILVCIKFQFFYSSTSIFRLNTDFLRYHILITILIYKYIYYHLLFHKHIPLPVITISPCNQILYIQISCFMS